MNKEEWKQYNKDWEAVEEWHRKQEGEFFDYLCR